MLPCIVAAIISCQCRSLPTNWQLTSSGPATGKWYSFTSRVLLSWSQKLGVALFRKSESLLVCLVILNSLKGTGLSPRALEDTTEGRMTLGGCSNEGSAIMIRRLLKMTRRVLLYSLARVTPVTWCIALCAFRKKTRSTIAAMAVTVPVSIVSRTTVPVNNVSIDSWVRGNTQTSSKDVVHAPLRSLLTLD